MFPVYTPEMSNEGYFLETKVKRKIRTKGHLGSSFRKYSRLCFMILPALIICLANRLNVAVNFAVSA